MKPLLVCLVSIVAALVASMVDAVGFEDHVPSVTRESVEDLLKITAASMLVIATLAVASMVSAYSSAGNTATPRTFPLVIADDVSQNALSTFIGVFIFSIVALIALMNGYYGKSGTFLLFSLTLLVLALVIITFVRWVDQIARLGRLGSVIDKVEAATMASLQRRRKAPTLSAQPLNEMPCQGSPIHSDVIGYVQHIDIAMLDKYAHEYGLHIAVAALPGVFATPDRPLAYACTEEGQEAELDKDKIRNAFIVGPDRLFDEDPRFGLVVLAEIASRALSPAVNDPGTAIDIIGTFVRLFHAWMQPSEEQADGEVQCKRVYVAELSLDDMFDDAFTPLARDGAALAEVQVRLQKAFRSLACTDCHMAREVAGRHARVALERAKKALAFPEDFARVERASLLRGDGPQRE